MIAFSGQILLLGALAAALFQAIAPWLRLKTPEPLTRMAAVLQCCTMSLAFTLLVFAFIESDFSLRIIAENSHTLKPLIYKITAAWGNHEGSITLWALILSAFACALALSQTPYPSQLRLHTLSVQGMLAVGTLLFILLASNPFELLSFTPADGNDLNPLLQDIGLAIHPPLLYVGYVGFSIIFSFAVAGLLVRQVTSQWAALVQPWLLVAWSFLTFGIGFGAWWAYRELGWGGYWFWDPVENVSLMPWLAGTALLHSNRVLETRHTLHRWVVLLAIFTFLLSMIGTFLVRSGMLTSVHSFAEDPTRGLFILGYIAVTTLGALGLYALRASSIGTPGTYGIFSRTGAILVNNLFLVTACLTILFATVYPIVTELFSDSRMSVGAPYFNTVFFPLTFPLLPLAALAPFLPWQQARTEALRYLLPSLIISFAMTLWLWMGQGMKEIYALLGFSFAAFLISGSVYYLIRRLKQREIPLATWGMIAAHFGLGVLCAGLTGSSLLKEEKSVHLALEESTTLASFDAHYFKEDGVTGPNYIARLASLKLTRNGDDVATLVPEYRYYPVRDSMTSEAAIHSTLMYDFYAVIGPKVEERIAVRLYYTPLMNVVWLGISLIGAGGLLSAAGHKRRNCLHD